MGTEVTGRPVPVMGEGTPHPGHYKEVMERESGWNLGGNSKAALGLNSIAFNSNTPLLRGGQQFFFPGVVVPPQVSDSPFTSTCLSSQSSLLGAQ